jgi:hypothetical protein
LSQNNVRKYSLAEMRIYRDVFFFRRLPLCTVEMIVQMYSDYSSFIFLRVCWSKHTAIEWRDVLVGKKNVHHCVGAWLSDAKHNIAICMKIWIQKRFFFLIFKKPWKRSLHFLCLTLFETARVHMKRPRLNIFIFLISDFDLEEIWKCNPMSKKFSGNRRKSNCRNNHPNSNFRLFSLRIHDFRLGWSFFFHVWWWQLSRMREGSNVS